MSSVLNEARLLHLAGQRIDELGLRVETSAVGPLVERLYAELQQVGLTFRPAVYVSNEWGCPDGLPLIGIPFYLADPRFYAAEESYAGDLEDPERILIGLRHEAGHAVLYAYRLHTEPEWQALFGSFEAEYHDDYVAVPFSRRFVRHLPGWYAQKHADEDFAETFAVWMTPGRDWRSEYAGWPALAKLEYVDRAMKRIADLPPVVDPATVVPEPDELAFTLEDYYRQRHEEDRAPVDEIGDRVDEDLRALFPAEGPGSDAASLVWDRSRAIMRSVATFTGARMYAVKTIIDFLVSRLRTLALRAAPGREGDALVGTTALVSTLATQFARTRHCVPV